MPIYYKDFTSEIIDTKDLFYALRENYENIDRKLLIKFRIQLEDLLFDKRAITVKFHPIHWRYHRSKFLNPRKNDWHDEEKSGNIFFPDFFMQEVKRSDEITFESLTDDEKIKIVIPENSENIKPHEKEEILNRLNLGLKQISGDNSENPYEWSLWKYDLYSLYESCELDFNNDRDYFEYFFAWRLALTDLFEIDNFLLWHLDNTFENQQETFKKFIGILLLKYDSIISNGHIITKTEHFIYKRNEIMECSKNSTDAKFINIKLPDISHRKANDGLTSLSQRQTVTLIRFLRESKIIFKDGDIQTNVHIARAFQVLTGYGSESIRHELSKTKYDKDDLGVVQEKLIQITLLIDKELGLINGLQQKK